MMDERDISHIHHMSVSENSKFIRTRTLKHAERKEPFSISKDKETKKHRLSYKKTQIKIYCVYDKS